MMTIESKTGKILASAESIFMVLSDFRKIEKLIPGQYISKITSSEDSCVFEIAGTGKIEMVILEKKPFSLIKYSGGGFQQNFFFWVQLKEICYNDTRIKLTLKADIPKVMQFMIKGKIEEALNNLLDRISSYHPSQTNINLN